MASRDYQDKEFKNSYQEVVTDFKNVHNSTYDPSTSDESDPGVVFLKTLAMVADKLTYKINYRNAQNSVTQVTDMEEGQRLFSELGYQMVKKKSATGELLIRYFGKGSEDNGADYAAIDLFTQFSNTNKTLVYTSVRAFTTIKAGESKSIKVQEGIPVRYSYEGVTTFGPEHLTTGQRLPLYGYKGLAVNGVIICTHTGDTPLASDWLNVGDNIFNSIDTNNLFSIGHDVEGQAYIQFYEESLAGLALGVDIWVLSSSGSAGNVSANKINQISSTISIGGEDPSAFIITHPDFTNGTDGETLREAMAHYYETLGVNESLVSERDYKTTIERILGPELVPLVSKALVTGIDGERNISKVISQLESEKRTVLMKTTIGAILSCIFVNALAYSQDYYESFQYITSPEVENLIRKALFGKSVVSNEITLVEKEGSVDNSTIYDKFIFDLSDLVGTIIIDSDESLDTIKEKVVSVISKAFLSTKINAGEMISESQISKVVKEGVPGVSDASFYFSSHSLRKGVGTAKDRQGSEIKLKNGNEDDWKRNLVAKTVISGNLPLFKKSALQIAPDAEVGSSGDYGGIKFAPENADEELGDTGDGGKYITRVTGAFDTSNLDRAEEGRTLKLGGGNLIQFYTAERADNTAYTIGVKYRLVGPQTKLTNKTPTESGTTTLKAGSIISKGSRIPSTALDAGKLGEIIQSVGELSEFNENYGVENQVTYTGVSGSYLAVGTEIRDGSLLNSQEVYALTIQQNEEFDFKLNPGYKLILKTDTAGTLVEISSTTEPHIIRIEGFAQGLKSSGPLDQVNLFDDAPSISSEKITTLTEMGSVLNPKFFYGLILSPARSGKFLKISSQPIMLEEGEHFIYSDEKLIDFIDLGAGTLISLDSSSGNEITLTNIVSYEKEMATQLVEIKTRVKIQNTVITTFAEGETVVYDGPDISNSLRSAQGEWTKLAVGAKFTVLDQSGLSTLGTFSADAGYYVRIGLILKTKENNTFELGTGQSLTLEDSSGAIVTFEGNHGAASSTSYLVTASAPLELNAASTNISSDSKLRFSGYRRRTLINIGGVEETDSFGEEGLNYSWRVETEASTLDIPLDIVNDYYYLLKFRADLSSGATISFIGDDIPSVSMTSTGFANADKVSIIGYMDPESYLVKSDEKVERNFNKWTKLGKGTYLVFVRKGGGGSNSKIRIHLENVKENDQVNLVQFIRLSGLNPDLNFEGKGSSDPSYYKAELKTEAANNGQQQEDNWKWTENEGKFLIREINRILYDSDPSKIIAFDQTYEAEAQVKNPTDPMSFYDTQHLMNRNILQVINLENLKNNLKVVRRNR